jgi:hypothetical protein
VPEKPRVRPKDLLLVGGPTDDGSGVNVLRAREERLEVGTLHPLKHGQAIHGDVVKLTPHGASPRVFEVETAVSVPLPSLAPEDARPPGLPTVTESASRSERRAAGDGPAMVATEAYRRNWDTIWSRPGREGRKLPN